MQALSSNEQSGSLAVSLLRITLGLIVLATWVSNVSKGLYGAEEFKGFLGWLASPDGNAGSLGFFHSLLDAVVVPGASFFGPLQLVVELVIGIGLTLGLLTRFFTLLAGGFFLTLFLAYFGGHEWLGTYILLFMAAVTVFLGYGGRRFGLDEFLTQSRRDSPAGNLLW